MNVGKYKLEYVHFNSELVSDKSLLLRENNKSFFQCKNKFRTVLKLQEMES